MLAEVDGHPVAVREGRVVLVAFHPELADDSRLHALLMAMATRRDEQRRASKGRMRDPRVANLAKILVGYSLEVNEGETCLIEGPAAGEPLIAAVVRGGPGGRRPPGRRHVVRRDRRRPT